MGRTTHLPYASEPAYENPNFFEEGSWWTNSSPTALPDKVSNCYRYPTLHIPSLAADARVTEGNLCRT